MKNKTIFFRYLAALLTVACYPAVVAAQVPVDDAGNAIGEFGYDDSTNAQSAGDESLQLSPAELEELVGPIALYPDDLLAVVLPASTYPLQVVQAQRFLEALENDPSLEPDPEWDDSVVALVNYPEVVDLLNEDLDWTWRLGEAVVAQQPDVVSAIEQFRNRAYAAGNLKSDQYQTVHREDDIIEIEPVSDDIIYVPYYEPEEVVYVQPRRVYYYYPRAYPVYYYPYPSTHAFSYGFFWGVTTAYTIGWHSNHLRVFHHSYHGHPYYGRHYFDYWWYRRPSIHVHNNIYIGHGYRHTENRYTRGDYWRPRHHRARLRYSDQRITRQRHVPPADHGHRARGNHEHRADGHQGRSRTDGRRTDRPHQFRERDAVQQRHGQRPGTLQVRQRNNGVDVDRRRQTAPVRHERPTRRGEVVEREARRAPQARPAPARERLRTADVRRQQHVQRGNESRRHVQRAERRVQPAPRRPAERPPARSTRAETPRRSSQSNRRGADRNAAAPEQRRRHRR